MVDPRGDAVGEQPGQGAVHRRVRLAENDRKFQRVGERHPGERSEQLLFGESHGTSVAMEETSAHPVDVTRIPVGCPAAMMPLGVGEMATERANRGRSWVCGAVGIATSTWFSASLHGRSAFQPRCGSLSALSRIVDALLPRVCGGQ